MVMKQFFSWVYRFDLSFQFVAGLMLTFMMGLTLTDIIMRLVWKPIVGSIELVCFSGAVVVGFSIPYSSRAGSHIYVDFLKEKLSARTWNGLQVFNRLVGIILFLFISLNFIFYSLTLIKTGEVTPGLKIPYYPITFGLAVSCLLESLTLFCDLMNLLKEGAHE
jgi:TRAP-type C4-dicarboxylate transport system permease small subunit